MLQPGEDRARRPQEKFQDVQHLPPVAPHQRQPVVKFLRPRLTMAQRRRASLLAHLGKARVDLLECRPRRVLLPLPRRLQRPPFFRRQIRQAHQPDMNASAGQCVGRRPVPRPGSDVLRAFRRQRQLQRVAKLAAAHFDGAGRFQDAVAGFPHHATVELHVMGHEMRAIQQGGQFRPDLVPGRRLGDHLVRYPVDADAERVDRVHRIDQLLEQHRTVLVHHGNLDQSARPLHHAARLGIDVERPHRLPRFSNIFPM